MEYGAADEREYQTAKENVAPFSPIGGGKGGMTPLPLSH